jgi:hypothetical protein
VSATSREGTDRGACFRGLAGGAHCTSSALRVARQRSVGTAELGVTSEPAHEEPRSVNVRAYGALRETGFSGSRQIGALVDFGAVASQPYTAGLHAPRSARPLPCEVPTSLHLSAASRRVANSAPWEFVDRARHRALRRS